MEANQHQPNPWSSAQTYTMAGICLLLGVVVGYLVHAPVEASSSTPLASVAPPSTASKKMAGSMPSPQDMKRMADKQVAPMIEVLQKNPRNAELLAKIGRAYLAAQQYPSAQQYYEQAIALQSDPETLNELSFVQYTLGDTDKAIATLNEAIQQDPKNSKLLFNLGMFEWHGKADPKAAIAAWQSFIKADPKNPKRPEVEKMIARAKQHLQIAPGTRTDKPAM
jgi:cytochrome c-type biogenesis protein CcmH/NrfG